MHQMYCTYTNQHYPTPLLSISANNANSLARAFRDIGLWTLYYCFRVSKFATKVKVSCKVLTSSSVKKLTPFWLSRTDGFSSSTETQLFLGG